MTVKNIKTELENIWDDYENNNDFKKTNTLFIDLIEKNKHNVEVIRNYLFFVFPVRNQDEIMNKNCISLYEEMIEENKNIVEPDDYLKLGAIYDELEDYENAVKYYLKAEKHFKSKIRNAYAYPYIAWYYDEIKKDYPKAIEYYKKYLEHNRVWFCDNKEKAIALIAELEKKIQNNK